MADHDKRETKQGNQAKSSVTDLGEFAQGLELSALQNLKAARDELDAGVPKVMSLTDDQRRHLGITAVGTGMIVRQESSFRAQFPRGNVRDESATDKRERALENLGLVLQVDASKYPPEKKLLYAADVKAAWAKARAALNEMLETPEARKMLDSATKKP